MRCRATSGNTERPVWKPKITIIFELVLSIRAGRCKIEIPGQQPEVKSEHDETVKNSVKLEKDRLNRCNARGTKQHK
jgi:hypothetical protein